MARWSFLFLIVMQLIAFPINASPICRLFYGNNYRIQDVVVSWYLPIDFGFNDKEIVQVNGQSVLLKVKPAISNTSRTSTLYTSRVLDFEKNNFAAKLMPDTYINGSHYFAVESLIPDHFLPHLSLLKDPQIMEKFRLGLPIKADHIDIENRPATGASELLGNYMLDLHNSGNQSQIENLVHYNLTWEVYRAEGTVRLKDIQTFMQLEKELDSRRKITFELWAPVESNGVMIKKTLGIMRVYDGSPFPSMSYNDFPTHHEALETDNRVPIERRYPEIDFRKDTDFIFEPGRLAKSTDLEGISLIEYQFQSLARYLNKKFGFKGFASNEYINKGKILVEITGRNLEKYMKPRSEGGFGYSLDYMIIPRKSVDKAKNKKNRKPRIIRVKPGTKYLDLNHRFLETDTKFLLHQRIGEYITNYAPDAEIKSIEDAFSPKN